MKVTRMIEELQKCNPEAEVKLHHNLGHNALFVLQTTMLNGEKIVFIEDESDCGNLKEELEERFKYASDHQIDELDFFMDLLATGFTLKNIKENLPDRYEYSKQFLEEHGLI